jgi:tetratricopeptide (TPR) repeat protein
VIGKDVPLSLLEALGVEPPDVVRHALSEMQAAEFLYQTRLFPEAEYTFKHALTHEVAYGSLLQERRRALHGEVLAAMERLHAGRLDEHLDRLALHAVRSESWDKAAAHGAEAGARAMGRWALRGAQASFEQALAALARLPETADNLRRAVDLHLKARACLVLLGDVPPMLGHLVAAEAAAAALADDGLRSLVAGHLAHTHWLMGQHQRTLDLSRLGLDLARRASDLRLEAMASFYMGEARYALGEFEQAADLLKLALDLRATDPAPIQGATAPLAVVARRWRSQALVELGRFDEASDLAREAIELARARNHPYALANAINAWGFLCKRRGTFPAAIPLLEEGLRLSRNLGFQVFVTALGTLLAEAWAEVGRPADAQALLDEVPPYAGSVNDARAWAEMASGRLGVARDLAGEALLRIRERGERGREAWVLSLLGEVAAREGPSNADAVADRFRQALALADELGMRPLAARCHLGLGTLLGRAGKRQEAQDHLTAATTLCREMDMRFWFEQGESALRGL